MRIVLPVLFAGCVKIAPFRGDAGDPPPSFVPRSIANAYREGIPGTAGTAGMTHEGFDIPTAGIVDGDLVLFIANADNGNDDLWPLPAPGFQKLVGQNFGPDGQTYVAAWKIADHEPVAYSGTYNTLGSDISGSATISLIAIAGTDPTSPISAFQPQDEGFTKSDPALVNSVGVITTVANSLVIYAAGVDWTPNDGVNTTPMPSGFTPLTSFGDRDTHWDWSCQTIAYAYQATPGATGAIAATTSAHQYLNPSAVIEGSGFTMVFAIAPAE